MANKNIVLSREQILERVWGYDYAGETRTVDMHVKKLREKLNGGSGWQIKAIYGIGYKFEAR
jgi:DNA-binding response OmpR family regulator